ncbi:hypothetical protein Tco_0684704 [Tanacetum coccineum]
MEVVTVGWQRWRVEVRDLGDRVYHVTRSILELAGKIPPENFSGGGATAAAVAGRQPEIMGERERIEECEFEDISSMDPPKSAPLNYEPLGNPDSVSRSLETKGDILFLEHLLIKETFSDPTLAVLPKNATLLVTPPLASKWEDEGDGDPFFWFSTYAITPSCYILTEGGDVSLLSSSPHIG